MNFKGRMPLLLLLLLGFGKAFVSAAARGTGAFAARPSHWLEKYSPSQPPPWPSAESRHPCSKAEQGCLAESVLRRNGQEEVADADPLKRKIDWGRVREVVFGSENMVQVITTGVATNIVVITGYVLAGFFYYLAVPMAHDLEALSFVISPQATATTILKGIVSTICVSLGYAMVTVLKEGPMATYERFSDLSMDSVMATLGRENWLMGAIGRGILGAIFQVVGWTLFGIVVKL